MNILAETTWPVKRSRRRFPWRRMICLALLATVILVVFLNFRLRPYQLIRAVEARDREEVQRLLNLGVSPNTCTGQNKIKDTLNSLVGRWMIGIPVPLLTMAIYDRHSDIALLLLEHGADPDAYHNSALWGAVDHGNRQLVRILLDHGANPNARDKADGGLIASRDPVIQKMLDEAKMRRL